MGLGQPHQMVELVARGVDIFDCVLPTRVARHATVYTRGGTLNLRGAQYRLDGAPLEPGVSLHNLHFYTGLMRDIRDALDRDSFGPFRENFLRNYKTTKETV
jgi:queuine tRNA-ribosyltransferase